MGDSWAAAAIYLHLVKHREGILPANFPKWFVDNVLKNLPKFKYL